MEAKISSLRKRYGEVRDTKERSAAGWNGEDRGDHAEFVKDKSAGKGDFDEPSSYWSSSVGTAGTGALKGYSFVTLVIDKESRIVEVLIRDKAATEATAKGDAILC